MTQLILDAGGLTVELPESQKGGYTVQRVPLGVDVEMISGRMVREVRGSVWQISYQYGFFDTEMKNKVIAACEKGRKQAISVGFLPQDADDGALTYRNFLVTSFTRPKFMWSRTSASSDGSPAYTPLWADFQVELREVSPSD